MTERELYYTPAAFGPRTVKLSYQAFFSVLLELQAKKTRASWALTRFKLMKLRGVQNSSIQRAVMKVGGK